MAANITPADLKMFVGVKHEHDPYQDPLRESLESLEKAETPPLSKISLHGMPASRVNLGWLHDCAMKWWNENDATLNQLAAVIAEELPQVVQRLKSWGFDYDEEDNALSILFETKDARTFYSYQFTLFLDDDSEDPEREDIPEKKVA